MRPHVLYANLFQYCVYFYRCQYSEVKSGIFAFVDTQEIQVISQKKKKEIYLYIDIHMQIVFIYGSYMYSLLFKMSDHCPRGELNFIYVRTFI